MDGHSDHRLRVHSPADMLWVVRRHWRGAFLAFGVTIALSILAYFHLPYSYRSEAKLLVRVGRETVQLDPTVMGPTMSVSQPRRNSINSEVEILRSKDLHLQLVDELGSSMFLGDSTLAGELARYEAARALVENLRVEPGIDSDIITASYTDSDPVEAQRILRRLLELYGAKHTEVYHTAGSLIFFEAQAAKLGVRVTELRAKLLELQRQLGVYSLESRQQVLIAQRAVRVGELETTVSALASAAAKVKELTAAIEKLEEQVVIERSQGHTSTAVETLRARLADLKLQERVLVSDGKRRDDPVLISVKEQLRLLTQLITQEGEERAIVRTALNPNRQRLELELMLEKAALAALMGKQEREKEQVVQMERQLAALEQGEGPILAVQNELAVLEAKRQGYLVSLEQARMDEALGEGSFSNISMVQQATLPMHPAGPPRVWILIVGLVLSVSVTIVVVLLGDYHDDAFLVPSDVRRSLSADLRAALPRARGLRMPISSAPNPKKLAKLPADVVSELELLAGGALGQGGEEMAIAVTSASGGAGASTVAFHLAAQFATTCNTRTVLIDADILDGALTRALVADVPGDGDAQAQSFAVHRTAVPNLHIVPRRRERMGVRELRMAVSWCRGDYGLVVIDLPPISACAAAVELATCADYTLFVVDSVRTDVLAAQRGLANLVEADAKILGVVLNRQVARNGAG